MSFKWSLTNILVSFIKLLASPHTFQLFQLTLLNGFEYIFSSWIYKYFCKASIPLFVTVKKKSCSGCKFTYSLNKPSKDF